MSVISPNEASKSWRTNRREAAIQLYLSAVEGQAPDLVGTKIGGYPTTLEVSPVTDWIDPQELEHAVAAVIQVDADSSASIKRFQKLIESTTTPLIAAAYDPPLALVRMLVRVGAHDVVPLPLSVDDLETSLAPLRDKLAHKQEAQASATRGRVVSIIKSVGGVGATALITQLAMRFAASEAEHGREACLIDLDVQFGDAAFQLGLHSRLTLAELLDAGTRLDGDLLRASTTEHSSGLRVIPAPIEMMPLEAVNSEHLLAIVDQSARELGTVFLDLPSNWTNWSLSLVARSDLVLLITELTVAGLNRAKRQLELFESQDLGGIDVRVVLNRFEKSQSRTLRPADVETTLGRPAAFTVGNDFALMSAAIDRGVSIDEVKRKSALAKDLDELDRGIAAALGLER